MAGNLTIARRRQLMSLLQAIVRGRDEEIFEIIAQMGIVLESIDHSTFRKDFAVLRARYI
jgi:predicted unusual protein kinase regulating ubiquinone biosynthesis (AarF/ABC1/UbiB family)